MATSEVKSAIAQVATERGVTAEDVLASIKSALAKAYVKEFKDGITSEEEVVVELDEETGESKILDLEGKDVTPSGFGRIAANAAKSVIMQKIRESEKLMILAEFKDKIGKIVSGNIFRIENGYVIIDLGKTQAIMPYSEQVQSESYKTNQRIKVLIK